LFCPISLSYTIRFRILEIYETIYKLLLKKMEIRDVTFLCGRD